MGREAIGKSVRNTEGTKSCLTEARLDGNGVGLEDGVDLFVLLHFRLLGTLGLCGDWEVKQTGTGIQKAGVPEPALPEPALPQTSYVTLDKNLNSLPVVGGIPRFSFSVKEEVVFFERPHGAQC